MKRKFETLMSLTRKRSIQFLIGVAVLYLVLVTVEIPFVLKTGFGSITQDFVTTRPPRLLSEENLEEREAPTRPFKRVSQNDDAQAPSQLGRRKLVSGLVFDDTTFDPTRKYGSSELYKVAKHALGVGLTLWEELQSGNLKTVKGKKPVNRTESCPGSISVSGSGFSGSVGLPCGLTLGSHVTIVGKPLAEHAEFEPRISMVKEDDEAVMVSQFMVELQGLKVVDGEEPPRIFHFNPRLKGDWSGKPVIELNTCYRMQWGAALRCDGWKSNAEEDTGKCQFQL